MTDLAEFYTALANAEARHADTFVELARMYAEESMVAARIESIGAHEARVIAAQPMASRVH
jgi:tRNA isopentenyl-2-thiomethyl-A-37 hydroxylase MiaE